MENFLEPSLATKATLSDAFSRQFCLTIPIATSLFPDNVDSHNIVPDYLCSSCIILPYNWRCPSHFRKVDL